MTPKQDFLILTIILIVFTLAFRAHWRAERYMANLVQMSAMVFDPNFRILDVNPPQGMNNGFAGLDIRGDGFQSKIKQIKLTKNGESDIPASSFTLYTPTTGDSHIGVIFDLQSKPTGSWNVVVTNGANQLAVLPDSFYIQPPNTSPPPGAYGTYYLSSGGSGYIAPVQLVQPPLIQPLPIIVSPTLIPQTAITTIMPLDVQKAAQQLVMMESVIAYGNKGMEVIALQKILEAKGLFVLPPDAKYGQFGPMTEKALEEYQKYKGILVTGIFDENTKLVMAKEISKDVQYLAKQIQPTTKLEVVAAPTKLVIAQEEIKQLVNVKNDIKLGDKGLNVAVMQKKLVIEGFLVMPSGANFGESFGPKTTEALFRYQLKYGLPVTGIVDKYVKLFIQKEEAIVSTPSIKKSITQKPQPILPPPSGKPKATNNRKTR